MADNDPTEEPSESEEYASSEEEEDVEAAILSRGKRSTAGRRLTSLVGKAAEDDQTFWGHDTWNDDDGSENESFHESDEDPEQRVDAFDSDFDDSEDDNAEEDQADADAEDKELAKQERRKKQASKNKIHGLAKAARDLARGTAGATGKRGFPGSGVPGRLLGDGDNAGIILNLPPTLPGGPSAAMQMFSGPGVVRAPAIAPIAQMIPAPRSGGTQHLSTSSSRHVRRATQHSKYSSRFRAARSSTSDTATTSASISTETVGAAGPGAVSQSSKRKLTAAERAGDKPKRSKTQMIVQEDLLMEAVRSTAPENNRWLLGRKRAAEDMETREQQGGMMKGFGGHQGDKKLVDRYSSKRGALNVLSFFEMDHVPEIFTQNNQRLDPPYKPTCVITGKAAKYKDPVSKLPYYDLQAYKIMKKRLQDGSLMPLGVDCVGKTKTSLSFANNEPQMTVGDKTSFFGQDGTTPSKIDPLSKSDAAISEGTTKTDAKNDPPKPTGKVEVAKKGLKRAASVDGTSGAKVVKRARKPENVSKGNAALFKSKTNGTSSVSKAPPVATNGEGSKSEGLKQKTPKLASSSANSTNATNPSLPDQSPESDKVAPSSTPVTPPHPESRPTSNHHASSAIPNLQNKLPEAESKPLSPKRATTATSKSVESETQK